MADLEAFLESEDPSWPGHLPTAFALADKGENGDAAAGQFEDDFDDFLPFQSAQAGTHPSTQAAVSADDWLDNDQAELPSIGEISQMQDRLFGSNAAARLEAGPLGMGSQGNSADQDFASQLQQLSWHAQRVRNIQDPDQRRKEAALVALAFSMQWSGDDQMGSGMNF